EFVIDNCEHVTDKALEGFEKFTNIVKLNLSCTKIRNLDFLKSLVNLKELSLRDLRIQDSLPSRLPSSLIHLIFTKTPAISIACIEEMKAKGINVIDKQ